MNPWLRAAGLLLSVVTAVAAVDVTIVRYSAAINPSITDAAQSQDDIQKCSGMYSKKSWGGATDPFIFVKFLDTDKNKDIQDPTVALIVFEWRDWNLIGRPADPNGETV